MGTRKNNSTYSLNGKYLGQCDLSYAMSMVTGRWKLQIIHELAHGPLRFHEIRKMFSLATEKMLADQLRALESDGLISRTVFAEVPVKVVYELTQATHELLPIFAQLSTWGTHHRSAAGNTQSV